MAYALTIPVVLGSGQTGISDLRAQLLTTAGATSGDPISMGFFEVGGGTYGWYYASFANTFRGFVKFYSEGAPSIMATAEINPEAAGRLRADGLEGIVPDPASPSINARQALAVKGASAAGKISGAEEGSDEITIKGLGNDTTRIVATVDDDGNRTAVTLSLPASLD